MSNVGYFESVSANLKAGVSSQVKGMVCLSVSKQLAPTIGMTSTS